MTLKTGYNGHQFYVAFDDHVQTVFSSDEDDVTNDAIFNHLFESNGDLYAIIELSAEGELIYSPPCLDEVWFSEEGIDASPIQSSGRMLIHSVSEQKMT